MQNDGSAIFDHAQIQLGAEAIGAVGKSVEQLERSRGCNGRFTIGGSIRGPLGG